MKGILCSTLVGFLFCTFGLLAQPNDTIRWSASLKLSTVDFQAKPDARSEYKGYSFTGTPYKYWLNGDTIYFSMYSHFICAESWFKNDMIHDEEVGKMLLLHEQVHFNIVELQVRKLKKRIVSDTARFTRYNYRQLISQYVAEFNRSLEDLQKKYDLETKYSLEHGTQKKWDEDVRLQIQNLDQFARDTMKIVL